MQDGKNVILETTFSEMNNKCVHSYSNKSVDYEFNQYNLKYFYC